MKNILFVMLILFSSAAADAEPQTKIRRPFFTVCADTHDEKKRSFDEQHALLAELGFDGMTHLGLGKIPERLESAKKYGLKVFCVYQSFNFNKPLDPKLSETLACLKDSGTFLALSIEGGKPSDASLDDKAVKLVQELKAVADPLGIKIVLYPHKNSWNEKVADCVRMAGHFDGKVGVMFNLCHWAAVDKSENLETVLQSAKPYLAAITIHGSDTPEEIQTKKGNWIQPLDAGSYDLTELFRILDGIGYTGPVGLQCFGIKGDAKLHLERSMKKWKEMMP